MSFQRPVIKIKLSRTDIITDRLSLIFIVMTWVFTFIQYPSLPKIIPVHFDLKGNINYYGNKGTIFILPIIITIVVTGLSFLNKYPHVFNYPYKITPENALASYIKATRLLRILKLIISVFTLAIIFEMIRSAKTGHSTFQWWLIPLFMCSMIIPVIISLYDLSKSKKRGE